MQYDTKSQRPTYNLILKHKNIQHDTISQRPTYNQLLEHKDPLTT